MSQLAADSNVSTTPPDKLVPSLDARLAVEFVKFLGGRKDIGATSEEIKTHLTELQPPVMVAIEKVHLMAYLRTFRALAHQGKIYKHSGRYYSKSYGPEKEKTKVKGGKPTATQPEVKASPVLSVGELPASHEFIVDSITVRGRDGREIEYRGKVKVTIAFLSLLTLTFGIASYLGYLKI